MTAPSTLRTIAPAPHPSACRDAAREPRVAPSRTACHPRSTARPRRRRPAGAHVEMLEWRMGAPAAAAAHAVARSPSGCTPRCMPVGAATTGITAARPRIVVAVVADALMSTSTCGISRQRSGAAVAPQRDLVAGAAREEGEGRRVEHLARGVLHLVEVEEGHAAQFVICPLYGQMNRVLVDADVHNTLASNDLLTALPAAAVGAPRRAVRAPPPGLDRLLRHAPAALRLPHRRVAAGRRRPGRRPRLHAGAAARRAGRSRRRSSTRSTRRRAAAQFVEFARGPHAAR